MFLPILRQLGLAFNGGSLLINARIDEQNPRCFSSNAKLFEFVEEQLLPMFNSPCRHTFRLDFGKHSNVNTFDAFFSSLFQHRLMGQISNLAIESLNIDQASMLLCQSWITILNWLVGVGNSKCYNMPGRERILSIYLAATIQNWIVLIDLMKQVWCFLMSYFKKIVSKITLPNIFNPHTRKVPSFQNSDIFSILSLQIGLQIGFIKIINFPFFSKIYFTFTSNSINFYLFYVENSEM